MPRWYRKSLLLESDNNFLIESKGTLHTFIIRKVSSDHFGQFTCLASNSLGREAAQVEVTGKKRVNDRVFLCFSMELAFFGMEKLTMTIKAY